MKAAMERAASRGKYQTAGHDLGGEFPIHDVERNEGGLLKVRIDGIQIQFVNSQVFIFNLKKKLFFFFSKIRFILIWLKIQINLLKINLKKILI
jgi:hypothetical protein